LNRCSTDSTSVSKKECHHILIYSDYSTNLFPHIICSECAPIYLAFLVVQFVLTENTTLVAFTVRLLAIRHHRETAMRQLMTIVLLYAKRY
jgi:hypothetical protein